MRIIGGTWRGRKLFEPKGSDITRPTTDRVREACASMIDSALEEGIEGARVLDAFGGSGAMGIEMLSRGASFAQFFDLNRAAAALIRKNLELVKAPASSWRVSALDVLLAAQRGSALAGPFDIVLLDPPYALEAHRVEELVERLGELGQLAAGSVVLYEHAAASAGIDPAGFEVVREKRYGICAVELLRYQGAAAS